MITQRIRKDFTFFLSSPNSQDQASMLCDWDVLISYGVGGDSRWLLDYLKSFKNVLIDSGAFSVMNSGKTLCVDSYASWAEDIKQRCNVVAIASLDDIKGNWELTYEHWRRYPWMFPTYHDSDPPEFLDIILSHSPSWLGLGMVPPRSNKTWLRDTLERIPKGVHVHGWALGSYSHLQRLDSVDSTGWFFDVRKLKDSHLTRHLTTHEQLEIVVKRYKRREWVVRSGEVVGGGLFDD